MSDCE